MKMNQVKNDTHLDIKNPHKSIITQSGKNPMMAYGHFLNSHPELTDSGGCLMTVV